ncbi:MAG: DUF362 domain-containing protein [Candidatus Latescibacterota bacterium]
MMKRREFIKKAAAGTGSASALYMCDMLAARDAEAFPTSGGMGIEEGMYILDKGKARNTLPEIRPEIRDNPRAVFLIETHVDARKDESGHFTEAWPQFEAEGTRIAKQLLVKGARKGGSIFFKPNFTFVYEHSYNRTNGVYSSPDFIVGMAKHLREIGSGNIACGEGPTESRVHRLGGAYDAFDPAGIPMIEAGYERWSHFKPHELNWKRVPKESPVWNNIPYFRPIGDPDNFLINVSALKCHLTGLTTLTVKNLQGCVPKGYGQFCTSWDALEPGAQQAGIDFKKGFKTDFYQRVEAEFLKHRAANFKRWDQDGDYKKYEERGGWEAFRKVKDKPKERAEFLQGMRSLMRHEMWMHRGLDSAYTLKPNLNIVCGIVGLDGEELHRDKIGEERLCNMVIAGLSPFEVDAVGSYYMGHDPRELWYTRVAKEKGYGECDPSKIKIYWIRDNGNIEPLRDLSEIRRQQIGLNWARMKDPSQRLFW